MSIFGRSTSIPVRILRERNDVTAKEVKAYRDLICCGMEQAKRAVINRTERLQVFDGKDWRDIPIVERIRNETEDNRRVGV